MKTLPPVEGFLVDTTVIPKTITQAQANAASVSTSTVAGGTAKMEVDVKATSGTTVTPREGRGHLVINNPSAFDIPVGTICGIAVDPIAVPKGLKDGEILVVHVEGQVYGPSEGRVFHGPAFVEFNESLAVGDRELKAVWPLQSGATTRSGSRESATHVPPQNLILYPGKDGNLSYGKWSPESVISYNNAPAYNLASDKTLYNNIHAPAANVSWGIGTDFNASLGAKGLGGGTTVILTLKGDRPRVWAAEDDSPPTEITHWDQLEAIDSTLIHDEESFRGVTTADGFVFIRYSDPTLAPPDLLDHYKEGTGERMPLFFANKASTSTLDIDYLFRESNNSWVTHERNRTYPIAYGLAYLGQNNHATAATEITALWASISCYFHRPWPSAGIGQITNHLGEL